MSQENVEKVREGIDAWNRRDFDVWVRHAHPDIEYSPAIARLAEGHDILHGPEEMRQYWDDWHSLWNVRVELTEVRDLGETVVAFGSFTTRGNASGAELDSNIGYVIEFEHGRVRRFRAYLDHAEALKAVGLEE